MKIKHINRTRFNELLPGHRELEQLLGGEVAWFANQAQTCLGTIALSADRGWIFAALRPNPLGSFHVVEVGQNLFNLYQTRAQLISAMQ